MPYPAPQAKICHQKIAARQQGDSIWHETVWYSTRHDAFSVAIRVDDTDTATPIRQKQVARFCGKDAFSTFDVATDKIDVVR
jgi:hypothetical protein